MRRGTLSIVLGVLIAVGAGVLLWRTRSESDPIVRAMAVTEEPSDRLGGCRGVEGLVASYRVHTETRGVVEPSALVPAAAGSGALAQAKAQPLRGTIDALMHVQVRSVQPDATLLALRLSHLKVDLGEAGALPADVLEAAKAPYLFRLDRRCRVREMGRPAKSSPRAARLLQGLLDAVHFALPEPLPEVGAEARYPGSGYDSFGAHVLAYSYRAVLERGRIRATLERRRERYDSDGGNARDLPVELRVANTGTTITLDDGFWFSRLDSKEATLGTVRGKLLLRVNETARVSRIDGSHEPFAGLKIDATEYVWGRLDPEALGASADPLRADLIGKPMGEFLAMWRMLLSPSGADSEGLALLIDYLRANPRAAAELLALLRKGELTNHERALLMHALGKAGTPEARSTLHEVMADAKLGEHARMQAVASAGQLVNADEQTVDTLISLSRRTPGSESEHDLVGNSATLAMGTLLGETAARGGKVAERVHAFLDTELASEEKERVREALVAVGNSGDERFLGQVEARAASDDPMLRTAAATSLRLMDAETTEPILTPWLRRESDPSVRAALIQSHREQVIEQGAKPSPALLETYIDQLRPGAPKEERIMLVNLLGQLARDGEQKARRALIAHYHRDADRDIRRQIAQYITAEELW